MAESLRRFTDFFISVGAEKVAHTEKSYLAHAIGVYNDLKKWGCQDDVCLAGMYHSIYGTERFQGFTLPLDRRDDVCELIGERAEQLAYWNCAMDRESFDEVVAIDESPYSITDRITKEQVEISRVDFDDLCRIHLCDWVEQAPRAIDSEYRREAYQRIADRLGGVAQESFNHLIAKYAAG